MRKIPSALSGLVLALLCLFNDLGAAQAVEAPKGWQVFCAKDPSLCNQSAKRRNLTLDQAARDLLNEVQSEVNATIRPRQDRKGEDLWSLAPKAGDCEDYALTKKAALIASGWNAQSLRFATVLTETAEMHLVLIVETTAGPLVLDNRFAEVMRLADLEAQGYHLLALEGAGRGGAWEATPYAGVAALLLAAG